MDSCSFTYPLTTSYHSISLSPLIPHKQFQPWQHIIRSSQYTLQTRHPLLSTCHESRTALLSAGIYLRGMRTTITSGDDRPISDHRPCSYAPRISRFGESMYWKPDVDVIFLRHDYGEEYESSNCSYRASLCNARDAQCVLDERIRYLGIDIEVWNAMQATDMLVYKGLEALFVVVERERVNEWMVGDVYFKELVDVEWEVCGRGLTTSVGEFKMFNKDFWSVNGETLEVVILGSLKEMVYKIRQRNR